MSPIAQVVIDRRGHLVQINERAPRLFSLTPADLGRLLQDLEISYRPVELRSHMDRASSSSIWTSASPSKRCGAVCRRAYRAARAGMGP